MFSSELSSAQLFWLGFQLSSSQQFFPAQLAQIRFFFQNLHIRLKIQQISSSSQLEFNPLPTLRRSTCRKNVGVDSPDAFVKIVYFRSVDHIRKKRTAALTFVEVAFADAGVVTFLFFELGRFEWKPVFIWSIRQRRSFGRFNSLIAASKLSF